MVYVGGNVDDQYQSQRNMKLWEHIIQLSLSQENP